MNNTAHFAIPKSVVEFVVRNKLERCFSVYLYLKIKYSGIVHESQLNFEDSKELIGISDIRTIKKYVKQLINLNLLGYNPETGFYFTRGFQYLYKQIRWMWQVLFNCSI